jgi:amidase
MSILDSDTLGAFCRHTHVERRGAAAGPLAGLTFGLKDLFDVEGHRTGFGNPDWLATHEPARASSPVLTALLAAGATMVGKTHTEEMAFSLTGENAHYGTPVNTAAPDRVPGGSSSGSASAVAGGLVDFAIGSDTGGSVRAPASFCGIWGFRPTHGRISLAHACPLAPSFDTVGWFARDAELLERVGRVLLASGGPTPPTPAGLPPTHRWLLFGEALELLEEPARERFLSALRAPLQPAGVEARLVHPTATLAGAGGSTGGDLRSGGLRGWFEAFRTLQHAEIWEAHGEWIGRVRPTFGPQIAPRFEAVAHTDPAAVAAARPVREAIRRHIDTLLGDDHLLVLPTVPGAAPLLNQPAAETVSFRERCLQLLCLAGLGGYPQLSLPLTTVDGLPFGISVLGARGADERLLRVAREFSTAV